MSGIKRDLRSELQKTQQELHAAKSRLAELEIVLAQYQAYPANPPEKTEFTEREAQRLQAEPAFLRSESHYRRALDSLLEGCQIIGFDWRYLYTNDAAAAHGRESKEALLGHTMMEKYPGIENTPMFGVLRRCMDERIVQHMENEFIYPDGTKAWFELSIQPVPEGIFILSLDITERKQAEAALNRYAQRMEILHQIDLGLIHGDSIQALVETTLKYVRQLIPCQRADVSLLDETTGEALIFAVDLDGETKLGQGVRVPIPPDVFDGYDTRHIRVFDDIRMWQETRPRARQLVNEGLFCALSVLLMDRERPIGSLGLFADIPGFFTAEHQEVAAEIANQLAIAIHQLHQSEELARHTAQLEQRVTERTSEVQAAKVRVEAILNNSADGILLVHSNLAIQQTNTAFDRLFACEVDDYFNQSLTALVQTDDADLVAGLLQGGVAEGQVVNMEVRARRKDGTDFDAGLSIGFIETGGFVCTIRDITERKRAEQALKARLEEEREFQSYLRALHEITIELAQINQLDDFYRRTVELGLQRLGLERLSLFLYDAETNTAVGTYGTDPQGKPVGEHHLRFVPAPDDIMGRAFGREERLYVDENVRLSGSHEETLGTGWNAAAILWNGTHSLGWLVADNLLSHKPISKSILDTLSLYALSVGALLAGKQTEAALRESEARYRLLADTISDVVIRFSPTMEYRYVSPSSRAVFGYEPEELLGPANYQRIHPDDIPAIQGLVKRLLEHPGAASVTYRFRHKEGHYIWLETSGRAIVSEQTGEAVEFVVSARDITVRKCAEEALVESERQLRGSQQMLQTILDTIPVRVFWKGKNSIYLGCNRLVALDAGMNSPQEIVGKSDFQLAWHEQAESYVADDRAIIETGISRMQYEEALTLKDGSKRWLQTNKTPLRDGEGGIIGVLGAHVDITERKVAEDTLRESEEKFRLFMEAAPVAVVISDDAGRITLVNHQAEKVFGYTRAELVDQPIELLVPESLRDRHVRDRAKYFDSPRMRPMHGQPEFFGRRKDGSEFPAEIELSYIETKAGLLVMSFVLDITERRQSAAELERQRAFLQQVIDVSPSMIFVKDYDARFVLVNPMVAKIYNTTVEALIGKSDADFNPSLTEVENFLEADRRVIASGQTFFLEEPITSFTGETRWLQTTKVPIIGADGHAKFVLGVATDITERRQAEETLRQAFEKEKELGELKSRFVSMASHEFRTPLATILALTETLSAYRRKLTDEQIEQRLGKIQDQVGHLRDIMEDVLLLARMQARRVEFNPIKLDLDALCRSVLDEFQSRPDVIHPLVYTCDNALRQVTLDKKLMRQIINNLVSNAVKYSPADKPITVNLKYTGMAVVLSVRDEGIGIPEADLKHLFEPFHRASNVGAISGTGLGLVITKESVELHGGTITVEGQVGLGTTFIVSIPIPTKGEGSDDNNSRN